MFQSFNVPKYSEISVKVLWNFVKDCEDLCNYFPDYEADQLPERGFILGILSTLRSDELRQLIKDALKNRSIQENPDEYQLIAMDADKKEVIMSLFPQKVCFHLIIFKIQTTPGRAYYLLKQGAKLRRQKTDAKKYPANLEILGKDKEEEKGHKDAH